MPREKKATVFLMNKIGNRVMTLHNYLSSHTNKKTNNAVRNSVKEMVKRIHERGISHGNLHGGNILVSIGPRGIKLWMIDFGRSTIIPLGMSERNLYHKNFKPKGLFRSTGLLSKGYSNAPLFYSKKGTPTPRRLNAHMLQVHYGVENYPRNVKSRKI
jgi:hypothetical protein